MFQNVEKFFPLALKSGFLFKNSCALMAIIVVNFQNRNIVYIARTKRNKNKASDLGKRSD